MKGGLTAEELKDVRAAWQQVLAANIGDLSSGLLLEYVLSLFCWCIVRLDLLDVRMSSYP